MLFVCEISRTLPDHIGSYRPSKTTQAIAGIVSIDLYEGIKCKQQLVPMLIDLGGANNSVNYEDHVWFLLDYGIKVWLVNWVARTLMKRTMVFRSGTWSSDPMHICSGLPQISPFRQYCSTSVQQN